MPRAQLSTRDVIEKLSAAAKCSIGDIFLHLWTFFTKGGEPAVIAGKVQKEIAKIRNGNEDQIASDSVISNVLEKVGGVVQ